MADDPFEDVLNLEENFYEEGYKKGVEDGAEAGKIEGRALGLEKGYEKFLEAGRLQGKAIVWANRLSRGSTTTPESSREPRPSETTRGRLPSLPNNPRLEKNVSTLYALVEPGTLSTENTDESVNDFDDRVKRAQGKAKIIEKMVGEGNSKAAASRTASSPPAGDGAQEEQLARAQAQTHF